MGIIQLDKQNDRLDKQNDRLQLVVKSMTETSENKTTRSA